MADFYQPTFLEKPSDYTRDSQGSKADTSKGSLFEGIGNFVGGLAKSVVNDINLGLRAQATKDVDQIQDFFILSDRVDKTGKKAVPADIEQAAQKQSLLRDAVQAGRVTQSTYWMMLDASARELRSRFPGFREEIDNIYQDITGAVPANRTVAEAFQKRASGASEADKELKYQEHLAQKEGTPEYAAAIAAGKTLGLAELKAANTKHLYDQAKEKQEDSRIRLEHARTDAGYRQADRLAREVLFSGIDKGASAIFNGAGVDGKQLSEISDRMIGDVNSGRDINPTDKQALAASVVQIRTGANADFEERMNRVRYNSKNEPYRLVEILSSEQRAAYRKEHQERVNAFLEPYAKNDVTMLSLQKIWNEAAEERGVGQVYRQNDWAPKIKAVQQALGPQLANTYLARDEVTVTSAGKLITASVFGDMFHHKANVDQMFKKIDDFATRGELDSTEAKKVKQNLVAKLQGMLGDPGVSEKTKTEIGSRLFSGDLGQDWFAKVGSWEDRQTLFKKFTDPRVADGIMKTSADVRENYKAWVDQHGSNELRKFGDNAATEFVRGGGQYSIQFDPRTQSFVPTGRERTDPLYRTEDRDQSGRQKIRDNFVSAINPLIASWSHVMQKSGYSKEDVNQRIMTIFQNAGVDISAGPVKSQATAPTQQVIPSLMGNDDKKKKKTSE